MNEYEYEAYVQENIDSIVDDFIDEYINASNPYEERANGDVVIMSKYDYGRQIIIENFNIDDEHFDGVDFDRLYDLVEQYMNDLICGVLNGAIEYCDNNSINYHL